MFLNPQGLLEDSNQPELLKEQEKRNGHSSYKESIFANTNFEKNMSYFHIMGHDEPHAIRRKQILQKHPEIKILFGPDLMSAWLGVGIVLAQFWCINFFATTNWLWYLVSSYCIGAVLSHALHALMHDFTHYLCFESMQYNKLMAIFLNFGQGVPSAITFGRYHSDHHTFMNLPDLDPDLPSQWEIDHVKGPLLKFLFMLFLPLFYSLRPMFIRPLVPNKYEILNLVSIIISNSLIYIYMGPSALGWLILSTYFGLSIHPLAAHLITEHYEFINRLETYNYLGIANFLILNLGYHTEHHDFPNIPWSRLPLVKKIAPEFYDQLPYHTNYTLAILAYIFDGYMGPFSRIVRKELKLNGKTK
ncbi:unnamed protein product (macronuclear) [Paramecium tetraurelia]|uniref:Sphingolipid delta4-desaturase N-terminal domain-containing protein n=1 Tax=Paramecium tetraurelia TaxID=5888 RepID=A0E0Y5_PARTE|nr:uncharacterized protein GSPATT00022121001 [Paramecium tetraurelia]CAK88952.1 unnamed protein product [Paramecium tetraurelia]|eukprot:XP_001456349.1 hypothetical protein (macronuclear) [Paramecium tetraurelia strain d4-2]